MFASESELISVLVTLPQTKGLSVITWEKLWVDPGASLETAKIWKISAAYRNQNTTVCLILNDGTDILPPHDFVSTRCPKTITKEKQICSRNIDDTVNRWTVTKQRISSEDMVVCEGQLLKEPCQKWERQPSSHSTMWWEMKFPLPVLFVLDLFPLQRNFVKQVAGFLLYLMFNHWQNFNGKL
jgi:hypothetical protein